MLKLHVVLEGDNCWPELREKGFIEGKLFGIARLPKGTVEGNTTITLRFELPDGKTVLAETTLKLLDSAVSAFKIKDEMEKN